MFQQWKIVAMKKHCCIAREYALPLDRETGSKLCHQIKLSGDDSRVRSFGSTDDSEKDSVSIISVLILLMWIVLEPW